MLFLDVVLGELTRLRGVDLTGYRRSFLERRLAARLKALGASEESYLDRLIHDCNECTALIDSVGINVSSFFRDPIVYELLTQSVLPSIVERKRREESREIRAWSAGCACGEEAFSLAILLHEFFGEETKEWNCLIFGTDIDSKAIESAKTAEYEQASLEHTKLGIIDRYFKLRGGSYCLRSDVRKMVRFSYDDVVSTDRFAPAESVFGGFDLVLCRNVLIYFGPELQDKVISKLHKSLAQGGYLILGATESVSNAFVSRLVPFDKRNRIFRKG